MAAWIWVCALIIWFLAGLLFAVAFFGRVHSDENMVGRPVAHRRQKAALSRHLR
jgi:hypothetical protein